jgi:NDP-sugar pyrophosphorylase family protein
LISAFFLAPTFENVVRRRRCRAPSRGGGARASDPRETREERRIGGCIRRILPYVKDDEVFCPTYGDGVGGMDITA